MARFETEAHENALRNGFVVRENGDGTSSVVCDQTGERLSTHKTRSAAWDWAENVAKTTTAIAYSRQVQ